MKTAIVQHLIRWNEPEWNLRHIEDLLHPGADLYVLAESFATGFLAEGSASGAGATSAEILGWMREQAARLDAAVAGSVATLDEKGQLRNRLFFVRPDGKIDHYDKRHLFAYAGEADEFVPGDRRVVVEWRGVRFLLQVCYDLRFPVFSRNRGDYDAIIYVANWPSKRADAWDILLRARAIENQCYVIGVNCIGQDSVCDYTGESGIVNPYGEYAALCHSGEEMTAVLDLDMEALAHFRGKFDVLADADDFSLNI